MSLRSKLIWHDLQPGNRKADRRPWNYPDPSSFRERQRLVFQGAPLALLPALAFAPAWLILFHTSRFAHSRIIAVVVFMPLASLEVLGVSKLVRCMKRGELDLLTVLAFGVFLLLFVILAYSGMFLFLLWREHSGF